MQRTFKSLANKLAAIVPLCINRFRTSKKRRVTLPEKSSPFVAAATLLFNLALICHSKYVTNPS